MAEEDFPIELQDRLTALDDSLSGFEEVIRSLHAIPLTQLQAEMSALDKAKVELVGAYALNSLYWMYLNVRGENPKEHPIKQELDRIRLYMARVKEIQDKEKAPKVDRGAAKRFVRSALWQQAQKKKKLGNDDEEGQESTSIADTSKSASDSKSSQKQPKSRPDKFKRRNPKQQQDRKKGEQKLSV